LFSSIVASFIIEIYKTLLPGNNQQIPNIPSGTAVRINVVLFLSLFLSIVSALSCTLIQQWCNDYLNFAYPRAAPHDSGRVRTYLFQGLDQFQMRRFMYGTHVLLHISVFLFFWAISDFFHSVQLHFGVVARYSLVTAAVIYMLLSVSPLIFTNSPYNTPMTPLLRAGCIILLIIVRSWLWFPLWCRRKPFDLTGLRYYKGLHFDRARLYSKEAKKRAKKLEPFAMEWLFTENDFSNRDMDKFLEGLPGYISSTRTIKGQLDQYLTADHILTRIKEHFMTCATSVSLSEEASIARVSSCVKVLQLIFQYSRERKEDSSEPDKLEEELRSQRTYIQTLMGEFQTLCDIDDPIIALRASCIRALAIQGFLSQLDPHDRKPTDSPQLPLFLIPIYKLFFSNDDPDTIQQLDDGRTPSDEAVERIWKNVLHDGPLANLTTLAQAVRKREHAHPSSLPFCWKVLQMLLTQFGTIHSEELTRVQSDFDNLHENTRTDVHDEEQGHPITPLLEILDTVARGRRLMMVFSGHPKYCNSADVVFGNEHLQNGDLLEAFAHCLPDFISKNKDSPKVCRDFMEKVVRHDDLWTSLQVNLWDTQRSDSPTPDKLRVFEDCCAVLDLAFSVLEDSREVDWRAPEFGSLLQHFESFIAHCFQGAFMGRATSFRIGIIRARICKSLLTQFWNDIEREGTVSFRSQWDVALLARLIQSLGMRDKEDVEFWNSYINGGHIGAKFTARALEMIDRTARDGTILILCKLGHLVTAAVPLDQSGLEPKDIEKVWEIQRGLKDVVQEKQLPLNRASGTVWDALRQLQDQVNDLCGKSTDNDRVILRRLLRMIKDTYELRFSSFGSGGPSQIGPAGEHGPRTPVVLNLTSPSGKSPGISNFTSEFTGGPPTSGTQTREGENGFERASSLFNF
jgi:hypothetical protein